MSSFACPLCATNRDFVSLAKMFKHITLYHQNDPNFGITCDIHNTCGVLYRSYSGYKSHIYRQHSNELHSTQISKNKLNLTSINSQQQDDVDLDVAHVVVDDDNNSSLEDNDDELRSISSNDDHEDMSFEAASSFSDGMETLNSILHIKKTYVSFLLQLREEFLLPKNVMHTISSYIVTLLNHTQALLEKKVFIYSTCICSSVSISSSSKNQDKQVIEFDELKHTFNDICHAIDSINKNEYQFIKHCEEYFGYSAAEEIVVSSPGESLERGYFLPIDKTLSSMLSSHSFIVQILENIQRQQTLTDNDPDLMLSIRDAYNGGRIDHDSLLLQLYVDDIGLTNPLGSKRDQHKLSMIYFSIEDIPDEYRSKIDFIQLLGVCDSRILKNTDKAKRFFQPIVDNLNWIQRHGLSINGIHLKFSVSTVVADNLAAHMIGGFQACFNTGWFCRRCYISYAEKNSPLVLSGIKRRTITDHDELVQEILLNRNKSSLMGVTGPSPLCDLVGFHATISLPGDIMHDFLEGICPMVIMSLLKQASSMRIITYARVQERMEKFNYGYFDRSNRPPSIQVKHLQSDRIVATASQKLCLFKMFPIIFHDIICQLPSFVVYKVLREILDLVLSYPFRKRWLPVLEDLCTTYYRKMLEHFPDKVVPKVHFIREYEQIVHDYGPPIKQWCFRYESNHAYFKKITIRTNNFKNVPKMLITRHRLKQCFKFAHLSRLKTLSYPVGMKQVQNTYFTSSMKKVLIAHFGQIDLAGELKQCSRLIHENIEYCRSAIYVIDLVPLKEQPVFSQVMFILKRNEKWWLLVDMLNTVSYDEDLFAWEVKSIDHYSMLDPSQLRYYYKGLDVYHVNNSSFVSFTNRLTLY